MIEFANPGNALDLIMRVPHVETTEGTANSHHCNEMACQGRHAPMVARHLQQLRKNCNCTDESGTHPHGIQDSVVIEIAVEQTCKDKCSHCQRSGKLLVFMFEGFFPHCAQFVHDPNSHRQRQHVKCLVQIVACRVTGQIPLDEQGRGETAHQGHHI